MQTQVYPVNAPLPLLTNLVRFAIATCLITSATSVLAQEGAPLILQSAIGAGVAKTTDNADDNGKFFVGRLERVQKNDGKAKRWALMDASNQVAAFVAPTTKYDMRRLLGSEIGVTARTFSSPDGEPPYVLVEAITPISPIASNDWKITSPKNKSAIDTSKTVLASHETEISDGPTSNPIRQRLAANGNAQATHSDVVHAQDWESMVEPQVIMDGGYPSAGYSVSGGCGSMGGCGNPTCSSCSTAMLPTLPCEPQTCGPPGWMWIRGENVQWWAKGMSAPPLVTTSNTTNASQAGVLGPNNTETDITSILYGGNDDILTDSSSGFRIRFGGWFGQRRRIGYEGEFFSLTGSQEEFTATSNGTNDSTVLARPFFNINPRAQGNGDLNPPARQDAQLVAFPGLIGGTIAVNSYTDLQGASGMLRWNKCCKQGCQRNACCDPGCNGGCGYRCGLLGGVGRCGYPPSCKLDLLLGYQYLELSEGIRITEDLTAYSPSTQDIDIADSFKTNNKFNGAVFGTAWEGGINRWTLEMMMKIAVGSVDQTVTIDGQTAISQLPAGTSSTESGGQLTQRTNIGTYKRSEFTMIPQLNTNLGFYLTPRLRAIAGYSLIYVGNVVRPGDQIDLFLNPDLFPPERTPLVGAERPNFNFNETDFWVHGLNIGLDLRW